MPTRSSPSVRCSPRRRSPTAKSLTHSPPSRLTSRVWKRLQRRSRWSGPPQTAPPHGSTDAGDEADDEAEAAGSGGGEATQRHNTLLTIGREAGAAGRRGERGRHAGVLGRLARALRCRQAGGMGSFRELRPAARPWMATPPGTTPANHRPERPPGGRSHPEDCPRSPRLPGSMERAGQSRLNLRPIQMAGGGDWLSRAGEKKSRCDRQESCDWQAESPVSYFH